MGQCAKMPNEVTLKQRKKTKQNDELSETPAANSKDEKAKTEAGNNAAANKTSSSLDIKSIMCLLSLATCGALSW